MCRYSRDPYRQYCKERHPFIAMPTVLVDILLKWISTMALFADPKGSNAYFAAIST